MIRRAAIYARFSSEQQNEKSCDDQIALCAGWASRQGIEIAASFKDEALSGASTLNRPALARLIEQARLARFDAIICEDLDRLSRKQADLHRLRDELTFLGISILTVADGVVTAMHAGLKGLMSEMFLADLANKTRRGLQARVNAGASGGGRSYGYDLVPGHPGEMTINEREAEIVRRIFQLYVEGRTPREIAASLNADRVPAPRGGKWNASTIHGSTARANGVLQNRLYIGELVWNRQRFIKDPATGKRVSRRNPEADWVRVKNANLAIVEPQLFSAAQSRKLERRGDRTNPTPRRPTHLLSGLLKCGCCGASYTVLRLNRLGCAGFRERGDCTNRRTVSREHIEGRVLAALREHLANPELLAEYIRGFHERFRQRVEEQRRDRRPMEKRLGELTRAVERIVDQIVDGTATPVLVQRMRDMEIERAELMQTLADLDKQVAPIALHPGAADHYRRTVEELEQHLQGLATGAPRERLFARLRPLVDKIVITPGLDSKKPVDLMVHGRLAELLVSDTEPLGRGAMVAGAGFEPATFRL